MGREWLSPPGNFYGSFALRAEVLPARYGEYSFVAALALRDAIAPRTPQPVAFKWPNDILLDGKKCAGILIETDGMANEFLMIGIGVNLYHAPDHLSYPAAALWPGSAPDDAGYQAFAHDLSQSLLTRRNQYLADGFGAVRAAWLEHAHALGAAVTAKTPVAEISGIFAGIDEDGSLLLTQDGREIKVRTADVRL